MSEITSSVHSVESYFHLGRMAPANVQRDYQWTPEQVGILVDDLIAFANSSESEEAGGLYFLGTMIAVCSSTTLLLYDGLQRTTTLSLLLAFLRDRIADPQMSGRLHACLNDAASECRLQLPPPDRTFAEAIAPRGATHTGITGGFHGRRIALRRNLNTIRRKLDRHDRDWLQQFARKLLENTRFVLIELSRPQMAERVFETVNMRGLAVLPHDLIKSRLAQQADNADEAQRLVSGWEAVRQNVAQEFEGFVQAVTDRLLDYPDLSRRDHMQQLSDWLAVNAPAKPSGGEQLIEEAKGLTFPWNRVISCTDGWTRSKDMSPLLPVWVFRWREWVPVALELTRRQLQKEVPAKRLQADLDVLQRFCLLVELAQLSEMSRRNVFRRLQTNLRRGPANFENMIERVTAEITPQVHRTLHKPLDNHQMRRSLMLWIEAQQHDLDLKHLRQGTETQADMFDPAQVEHIFPQNPDVRSGWHRMVPDPSAQAVLINLIGNLVVVPKSINEELGRHDFNDKRRILLRHRSRLKKFITVQDVFGTAVWTPDLIRKRTDRMLTSLCQQLRIEPMSPISNGTEAKD